MLVIDFIGAMALFTADTLLRAGEYGIVKALTADEMLTIIYGLSGLITLNVAASLGLHLTDPEALKQAAAKETKDKIQAEALKQLSENSASIAAEISPSVAQSMADEIRSQYGFEVVPANWIKAAKNEAGGNKPQGPLA